MFTFLWALPAVREFYEYVNHSKQVKRMGVHAWLLIASVVLETLIVFKFSQGQFEASAPKCVESILCCDDRKTDDTRAREFRTVKVAWSLVAAALVLFPIIQFGIPKYRRQKERKLRAARKMR